MYIDRNTAATRERTYERPDPVSLTEQAGYIPPQDQIESMILAGQRSMRLVPRSMILHPRMI